MNGKALIKKIIRAIFISFTLTLCTLSSPAVWASETAQGDINIASFFELYNIHRAIKIIFFHWDKNTQRKQEFIGTAELKDSKLTFEVNDVRLEKMLKGDFNTVIVAEENGRAIEKLVVYPSGTVEHLYSLITHCKDISCIAEVVE